MLGDHILRLQPQVLLTGSRVAEAARPQNDAMQACQTCNLGMPHRPSPLIQQIERDRGTGVPVRWY